MSRSLITLSLCASALFGQYTVQPAGAPPAELDPAVTALLVKDGVRIVDAGGKAWCEVWVRASAPPAANSTEENVSFTTVPHGVIMGAIRWPANGYDRRGQTIKPGVYTLRYSNFPVNGDHQGAAPQRDFLLMLPAALDKDAQSTPDFKHVTEMSAKASGTPHPAVLSVWKVESDFKPGFAQAGETDWALQVKIGDLQFGIILVGKVEG
ncbi:MAG: hypothetical protein FJW40_14625 [Acidobacteria bacterium]|nr:hypothetical protein [Acidobacteriota bacterium]